MEPCATSINIEKPAPRTTQTPRVLLLATLLPALLWTVSLAVALLDPLRPRITHGLRWIFVAGPFFDFTAYRNRMVFLHTPYFLSSAGYPWFYPAPCIFLFLPFSALTRLTHGSHAALGGFEGLSLALAILAATGFALALTRRGLAPSRAFAIAAAFVLFSWPLYFALQRGNVELLIWPILALAVFAYATNRFLLAALCIGVAGFKLYPLLCLGLLLPLRRYREITLGLATASLLTILALKDIGPTIAIAGTQVQTAIANWTRMYAVTYDPGSVAFDHTGYELLKFVTAPLHPAYPRLEHLYLASATLVALLVFFLRVRYLPRTNQVVFFLAAMIFLPPASFDYTLLHLYIPFAWLALVAVRQARTQTPQRALAAALLLCSLLVAPETFLLHDAISYGSLFKALLLLILLVLVSCASLEDLGRPLSATRPTRRTTQ